MKNNAFILLLLPVVGIGAWMLYLASFTQSAEIITLPVRGYDPRNLLSGHYIQYQIDWERADCNQSNWKGSVPGMLLPEWTAFMFRKIGLMPWNVKSMPRMSRRRLCLRIVPVIVRLHGNWW